MHSGESLQLSPQCSVHFPQAEQDLRMGSAFLQWFQQFAIGHAQRSEGIHQRHCQWESTRCKNLSVMLRNVFRCERTSNDLNLNMKWLNLKSIFQLNTIWVSCEGENPADLENVGPIKYYPRRGFPGFYYPYENSEGYLSPLVAVHFERPVRKFFHKSSKPNKI